MPSTPRFFAQIQSFFAFVKGAFAGFPRETARLLGEAQVAVDGKLEKLPSGRRKPVLVAVAAGLAVVLLVLVGVALQGRNAFLEAPDSLEVREFYIPWNLPPQTGLIPPEELFLPDEPDFVPGVLLGRERRAEWTTEDAEPWWQNPLADGEEQWRARIEEMVDEIMEGVP